METERVRVVKDLAQEGGEVELGVEEEVVGVEAEPGSVVSASARLAANGCVMCRALPAAMLPVVPVEPAWLGSDGSGLGDLEVTVEVLPCVM